MAYVLGKVPASNSAVNLPWLGGRNNAKNHE